MALTLVEALLTFVRLMQQERFKSWKAPPRCSADTHTHTHKDGKHAYKQGYSDCSRHEVERLRSELCQCVSVRVFPYSLSLSLALPDLRQNGQMASNPAC